MSIQLDIDSPNKKALAQLLRSIADLIQVSANKSILIKGKITFQTDETDC